MSRNPLLLVVALAVAASFGAVAAAWLVDSPRAAITQREQLRIVCLIPPITETLYQIGAGQLLVGRSDYCEFPPEAMDLPACGTTLHPNLEAIARLQPGAIIGENSVNAAREQLRGLAPTEFLPWLTREEVVASTRELGRISGRVEAANLLADELEAALPVAARPDSPRVLLVMPHQPGQLNGVWFLKRNSLHGAVLHAAGGRNAVDEDVPGTPSLGLERVLELDPEMIIVLHSAKLLREQDRRLLIADWSGLTTLRAVRENRISVINGRHMYPAGRDILRLVEELRAEIERLSHD